MHFLLFLLLWPQFRHPYSAPTTLSFCFLLACKHMPITWLVLECSSPSLYSCFFIHSSFYSFGQEDPSWPQNPILKIHPYQNFPLLFSNTFFPWYTSLWNQSYYLIIMCGLPPLHLEYNFHECWDFYFFHVSIPSIWMNSWHILGTQ